MYFVNFFSKEVTRELIVSSSGKFDQAYASLQKLYGGQVVLKQKHYYTIIFTECSKNLVLSKKIEIETECFSGFVILHPVFTFTYLFEVKARMKWPESYITILFA